MAVAKGAALGLSKESAGVWGEPEGKESRGTPWNNQASLESWQNRVSEERGREEMWLWATKLLLLIFRGESWGIHGHSSHESYYCHCPSFPRTQKGTDNSGEGF